MFACRGGHAAVAAALLEAGADPRAVTSKGSSPLHFAASAGSLSVSFEKKMSFMPETIMIKIEMNNDNKKHDNDEIIIT